MPPRTTNVEKETVGKTYATRSFCFYSLSLAGHLGNDVFSRKYFEKINSSAVLSFTPSSSSSSCPRGATHRLYIYIYRHYHRRREIQGIGRGAYDNYGRPEKEPITICAWPQNGAVRARALRDFRVATDGRRRGRRWHGGGRNKETNPGKSAR